MTSRQKRGRKRNFHEGKRNSSRSKHDLLRTTGTKNEEDGRERQEILLSDVTDNEGVNHVLSFARGGKRRETTTRQEERKKRARMFPSLRHYIVDSCIPVATRRLKSSIHA
jgi:hypothetical protein